MEEEEEEEAWYRAGDSGRGRGDGSRSAVGLALPSPVRHYVRACDFRVFRETTRRNVDPVRLQYIVPRKQSIDNGSRDIDRLEIGEIMAAIRETGLNQRPK